MPVMVATNHHYPTPFGATPGQVEATQPTCSKSPFPMVEALSPNAVDIVLASDFALKEAQITEKEPLRGRSNDLL